MKKQKTTFKYDKDLVWCKKNLRSCERVYNLLSNYICHARTLASRLDELDRPVDPGTSGKDLAALLVSQHESAIGMFLEYRDVHGYDEEAAKIKVLDEARRGWDLTVPEVLGRLPEVFGLLLKMASELDGARRKIKSTAKTQKTLLNRKGIALKLQEQENTRLRSEVNKLRGVIKDLVVANIANLGSDHECVICYTHRIGDIPEHWQKAKEVLQYGLTEPEGGSPDA